MIREGRKEESCRSACHHHRCRPVMSAETWHAACHAAEKSCKVLQLARLCVQNPSNPSSSTATTVSAGRKLTRLSNNSLVTPVAHMSRILAANIRLIFKRPLALTSTPLTELLFEGAASAVLMLSPCQCLSPRTSVFVLKTLPLPA